MASTNHRRGLRIGGHEHAVVGEQLAVEYLDERYPVTVEIAGPTPIFDPENTRRARRVYRYTIDVSDVTPVTLGATRSWPTST